MYVGTHYNSYYNSLFGNRGSVYGSFSKNKSAGSLSSGVNNSASSGSLKYVQDLKTGSSNLLSALKELSSGTASNKKTLISSNSAALTVSSSAASYKGDTSVDIEQIATGQTNTGTALYSNAKSSINGYQQFSIETNGRTYQFSINVGAGDSNQQVQQKMADAINMQGIGITASVVKEGKSGTSALSLSAQSTGDTVKSKFVIKDVYGSAVANTGAATTSQEAQNAVYSINGGATQTSTSNNVDLGNGITATLLQASEETITISQAVDKQYAAEQVKGLVSAYNQLYGAVMENTSDSKANILLNQLVSTSRTYSSSLSKLGISFDSNGYMQVNSDKVAQAAENGSLERFFSGSGNYGFASQLSRIASNVSTNTASYIGTDTTSTSLISNLFNNYSGAMTNNSFFNTYQGFLGQNGSFNTGLLFDLML